jgi:hypothetical protein
MDTKICNATITINRFIFECEKADGHDGTHLNKIVLDDVKREDLEWSIDAGGQVTLQSLIPDDDYVSIFKMPLDHVEKPILLPPYLLQPLKNNPDAQALRDARHMLERSQGDVSSEEHKRSLQAQAAVSALIAIAETTARQTELTQALLEKLGGLAPALAE